ncbi:MAG: hypothetical protein JSW40_04405 [Candidatus Omnitrophota bacterium]|nr:MAG: hypothetical protein JSW40_04405 [Candidatus Omnitrophota bacterium]
MKQLFKKGYFSISLLAIISFLFIGCGQPGSPRAKKYEIPDKHKHVRTISIDAIKAMSEGSIEIKEIDRQNILILIVDKYGDGHRYIVDYTGYSKSQALKIIKNKPQYLTNKKD